MNVIPKVLRTRVNRLAHDRSIQHEQQLRDGWNAQLADALENKATFDQLQVIVGGFEGANETGEMRRY